MCGKKIVDDWPHKGAKEIGNELKLDKQAVSSSVDNLFAKDMLR